MVKRHQDVMPYVNGIRCHREPNVNDVKSMSVMPCSHFRKRLFFFIFAFKCLSIFSLEMSVNVSLFILFSLFLLEEVLLLVAWSTLSCLVSEMCYLNMLAFTISQSGPCVALSFCSHQIALDVHVWSTAMFPACDFFLFFSCHLFFFFHLLEQAWGEVWI